MILIGQYDSPFVRRVGIALTVYGVPFEHRPWSVFGDADKIQPYNPLIRVPTLVLDDGTALLESHAMLDYLDSLVAPEVRMFPVAEPDRHRALRITALATGLAEKAVSLFYEQRLHQVVSEVWVERCRRQIRNVAQVLEAERAAHAGPWFGEVLGHADVAVAVVLRFLSEVHPGVLDQDLPALRGHAARAEALPAFRAIQQPFIPPT